MIEHETPLISLETPALSCHSPEGRDSFVKNTAPSQLETLFKNLPGMAYRCLNLSHWPMDFVSDGCFNLSGFESHQIIAQTVLWGDFTHPEDIDYVEARVKEAVLKGEAFEVEYRIISRDGTEKWVWERGRPTDTTAEGVAVLEGFITDITSKKQSELALKSTQVFAQAVVDSAIEGIITLDQHGYIESYNQAAKDMFGDTLVSGIGHRWQVLISPQDCQRIKSYFNSVSNLTTEPPAYPDSRPNRNGYEAEAINGDREAFPIFLFLSKVQDEPTQKFVLVIRDLSIQKATEQKAREQREVLAHVDRLNTLGEMAAGIAHEINQPLTAISLYANAGLELASNNAPDGRDNNELFVDLFDKLSLQAHRAGSVLEHMQKLTRPRESKENVEDCFNLLAEVHKLAEVEARMRNFTITLCMGRNLPNVLCDAVQIQQVILNLLRNGMESMEQANRSAEQVKRDIILQANVVNDEVKISIIDHGIGVPDELHSSLFQPFNSTKNDGMGLGLSISQSIIESHGSTLALKNNQKTGATFYFFLPTI